MVKIKVEAIVEIDADIETAFELVEDMLDKNCTTNLILSEVVENERIDG